MVCPFEDPLQRASTFLNWKRQWLGLWWDVRAINHAENCLPNWEYYHCLPSILRILPLPSQYILSLLMFLNKNKGQFTANSQIYRCATRQQSNFHQPITNRAKYQKGIGYMGWKCLIGYLLILRKSLIIRRNLDTV